MKPLRPTSRSRLTSSTAATTGPLARTAPKRLNALTTVNPEDTTVVHFAGHGLAGHDHSYLVPHELGYAGPRKDLRDSLEQILLSSISDQELEQVSDRRTPPVSIKGRT